MPDKAKVAVYWLGSCGGCDEAIVDLNVGLLKVADSVEIVLWPIAMDFKNRKAFKPARTGRLL